MTVVSSKEFTTHQRKYFGIAMDGGVCIKRGRNMFRLMHEPVADEQPTIFEPDEDLRRSISIDELRERVKRNVHQWYKERNESSSVTGGRAVS
jgi:predicted transcriptional regulator